MNPEEMLDQAIGVKVVRRRPLNVERCEIRKETIPEVIEWIKSYGGSAFISVDRSLHVEEPCGWVCVPNGNYIIHGAVNEFYSITPEMYMNYYEDVVQVG